MPYITKPNREAIDREIEVILGAITAAQENFTPGDLNYIISRIIWSRFNAKRSYTRANELVGVLECVKQEFIRRKLNVYEDNKIIENGDLEEGSI
jgi:hypothetical protein